jgi:cytochrome c
MKHLFLFLLTAGLFIQLGCSGSSDNKDSNAANEYNPMAERKAASPEDKMISEGKGIGEFKEVALNNPLDPEMAKRGRNIYDIKCAACHKLTEMRVVGPGWKGVTTKRKPEWILNMTTNIEVMLEKDPEARELLKECLVRMPNQNLTTEDARDVLEFMFENDGLPVAGQ